METRRGDSTEYVTFLLTTPDDITGDTVEASFDNGITWHPTEHCAGGVRLMPGPAGGDLILPTGTVAAILRIHDTPETPVIPAGSLRVTT